MKARKSIVAVILTLCMILGCAAPVFATAESSNLSVSVDKTTDVEIGDTVTVTLTLVGNPELASLNGGIAFDKEAFECTGITNGNGKTTFNVQFWDDEEEDWADFKAGAQSTVAEANTNGTVGASFNVSSTGNKKLQMKYSALIVATFKALKGGTATFKAYEDSSTYPAGGTYAFKGDGNSVTVTVNEPVVPHTHTLTPTAAKAPTCTEDGNIAYWTCTGDDGCGKIFSDEAGTKEITQAQTVDPAKGHKYGAPNYQWADDHSTCTGTVVCANDASHTITETVTATVATVAATCEAQGGETYTATFTKEQFTTQTYVKDPADPALGHDLVKTDAKPATCTEAGNIDYWTCKREGCGKIFSDAEGKTPITLEETVVPATGHKVGSDAAIAWSGDTAKINFTCGNCSEVISEDAEVTAEDNILVASYNGTVYDKKHKDSTTNVGSVDSAKDESGNDISSALTVKDVTDADLADSNLLDPAKAAAVDSNLKEEELTVVWQKEITAAGTTGKITMKFKVSNIGPADKIFVFHFTGGKWVIEAEGEEGVDEVEVTFNSMSPVALVVSSAIPQTGDNTNMMLWACAFVVAAAAAVVTVRSRKRGKHEA